MESRLGNRMVTSQLFPTWLQIEISESGADSSTGHSAYEVGVLDWYYSSIWLYGAL